MATAQVNGIEIYYEEHGSGEPLLLIMGLGANGEGWYRQVPAFSCEFRLIAFDNRGAGRSEKPNEPYTMRQLADDAAGLLDALEIGSAHVFGVSLGGMIAQELVLSHPLRGRALVLGATMAGGPTAAFAGPQLVRDFIALTALPKEQAVAAGLKLLYSAGFIEANRESLVQRALAVAHLASPLYALQRQFMAVVGFNAADRLRAVGSPALVMTGTEDRVIPAANSRIIAEGIRDSRLVEFEGSGHGFLVERAVEVNEAVLAFFRERRTEHVGAK